MLRRSFVAELAKIPGLSLAVHASAREAIDARSGFRIA